MELVESQSAVVLVVWKPGCDTLSDSEHVDAEDFHSGLNKFLGYSGTRLFLKKLSWK